MSRSPRSGPADSTARAFVRVGFANLVRKLHGYATNTLRFAAIDDKTAGVVEAGDLVNTLVEKGLEGALDWTLPEDATDDEIVGYACRKLYGMRSNLRKQAALAPRDDDALDAQADEAPGALELLVAQSGITELTQAFAHDAEASAHIERLLDGKKRADIMAELGCTKERANVIRQRILRGLKALCADTNDESEASPRSSGLRGTYHEPQATEERQRAAREPHGGARRARG